MMPTVTFAREYRHQIGGGLEERYAPGATNVREEIAQAARKAGALKEETSGQRPAKGNRTRRRHQPQG